jgi:branched-subunit amino acid aminotransferase/4-amino-4-deoxychorismate lyase
MALAAQHGVTVRERRLRLADLRRWTECFITSSSRRLMPITVIDGQPVGDGRVGPVTRRLMAIFDEFFQREIGNA